MMMPRLQIHRNVQRFRGGLIFKAHRLRDVDYLARAALVDDDAEAPDVRVE